MSSTSSNTDARRSSNPGPYLIVIENLPLQYTWQDLKDLIRREASHGIWTEMALYPNGKSGGKGHARVKRPEEARNLYTYLTTNAIEGRRLRIHLWDISGSVPKLLGCNCTGTSIHPTQSYPAQGQEVTRMALAPGWQTMTPMTPTTPMTAGQASHPSTPSSSYVCGTITPASSYASTPASIPQPAAVQAQGAAQLAAMQQAMMSLQLHTQDPRYPAMMQQYQQRAQALLLQQATQQRAANDAYAYTSNGLPVNTNQGSIRTESRGVFVSGLNYKARSRDVEALFNRAGEISKCEVQKDAASGRSKGKATIRYSSTAGAQQAISMLNNRKFMDMALKVRLDTEQTWV
ncbi:hypothetical protein LTR91_011117 [Friedmanniomyces endolithicus]|uniref:RRM domain-containing protein n=1 Tax=Friedmanniomyces endolithicus TaxID=329885 RepID=A0AAN6KIA7_9PEZI|nr:hypothetical protein LTR57_018175 [Friedmanniomyces endolithicus]KAK0962633.1 hypothetical protein LTS01_019692 [Friedmanniomyces endolithicus]KAK0983752.1 hypothetical protein LTR91_011117 [Friedmanniomyces endolithicus]KAK1021469.1 hypothetical protein LTS16_026485 [Friedmanniomyces endolithicus]